MWWIEVIIVISYATILALSHNWIRSYTVVATAYRTSMGKALIVKNNEYKFNGTVHYKKLYSGNTVPSSIDPEF